MKTYKIEFNDFGVCYVMAENISKAAELLIKSGYGGEDVMIKSIIHQNETSEPLN